MAGLVSTTQGTGPAQTALLLGALLPSGAPQGTSTATGASGLQAPATDTNTAVGAQQTLPDAALASEPILQSGNSQPTTDVLDGVFVGLAKRQDDDLGQLGF